MSAGFILETIEVKGTARRSNTPTQPRAEAASKLSFPVDNAVKLLDTGTDQARQRFAATGGQTLLTFTKADICMARLVTVAYSLRRLPASNTMISSIGHSLYARSKIREPSSSRFE